MMKAYRCNHRVEAAQWKDTDENREAFVAWFEANAAVFATRGPVVVLPGGVEVMEGEWIMLFDGDFVVMPDDEFRRSYEEIVG